MYRAEVEIVRNANSKTIAEMDLSRELEWKKINKKKLEFRIIYLYDYNDVNVKI